MRALSNEALVLEWLVDFERADAANTLSTNTQRALRGTVIVLARAFESRWGTADERNRSLADMTAEDASNLLTSRLPGHARALDPDVVIDGVCTFLIWAAKTNRVRARGVEYACRRSHREAIEAMRDERRARPGAQIVLAAIRDRIDPEDLVAIREHAIRRGMDAAFVDEFLPPGPVCLADGKWLWLRE